MAAESRTGIDPKRMVIIFYVFATIVLGFFLEKLLGIVFTYARLNDIAIFQDWTLSSVLGFGIAVGAAVGAWSSPKAQTVSMEIANELWKVTWPTMRETRAATVAVVIATFVAAAILGLFDTLWAKLSSVLWRM